MKNYNIDMETPVACLTVGQLMEAMRTLQEETLSPPKELPKFLNVKQLAELTGYSVSTIHIKNCKKEIPGSRKLNGRVLFDTSIILEWIESGAVPTQKERLKELEKNFQKKGGKR